MARRLSWLMRSQWHELSICGRFTVNRANPIGDTDVSPGYLAWARAVNGLNYPGFTGWGVIGLYPSIAAARAACEEHAKEVFRDA